MTEKNFSQELYDARAASIAQPRPVRWTPQPDITAHELALAMPVLFVLYATGLDYAHEPYVETLPPNVRRHFTIG